MNLKFYIRKNEMTPSASEAKYLGYIIPNGVVNHSQLVEAVIAENHFAKNTVDAVMQAAAAVTRELCANGSDVNWGPVKFLANMHGSAPCEDSAFSDGTQCLTIDAEPTNVTRAILEGSVPTKISSADVAGSIKFSNIMDVETEEFGLIQTSKNFQALGNGITLDGEGEYLKVLDRKTDEVKATATVVSVSKGQRAKCTIGTIPSGDYVAELATKGLAGEDTPRTFRKNVRVIATPPTVTVTGVKSNGATLPDRLIAGATTVASGANLAVIAGDTLKASWMHEGELFEHTIDHTKLTPNAAGTEITFSMTDACPEITSQCAGDIVMFTFTLHGGVAGSPAQTVSHTAEVVASAL